VLRLGRWRRIRWGLVHRVSLGNLLRSAQVPTVQVSPAQVSPVQALTAAVLMCQVLTIQALERPRVRRLPLPTLIQAAPPLAPARYQLGPDPGVGKMGEDASEPGGDRGRRWQSTASSADRRMFQSLPLNGRSRGSRPQPIGPVRLQAREALQKPAAMIVV
jgi:hypothetical protein